MSLPISTTPILTGKDAKKFENALETVKSLDKKEIEKIRASYNLLKIGDEKCKK